MVNPRFKDGYVYETIGGNNFREAYQQLLEEDPELKKEKMYSYRLCSVYTKMERQFALWLASKHNRATSFYLETSTWDKVCLWSWIRLCVCVCACVRACVHASVRVCMRVGMSVGVDMSVSE